MSISVGFGGISNPSSIYDTIEPKNLSEKLDLAEAKESSKHPLINIIKNAPPTSQQSLGEVTDEIMISDEAQEEMNYIGGTDGNDMHAFLSKKYGYNWMFAIRGYYWPKSHVMLYIGDYECPNCTTLVSSYLFSYFPDIKYVGFGCNKGNPGEIWEPKIIVIRSMNYLKDDLSDKQTETTV